MASTAFTSPMPVVILMWGASGVVCGCTNDEVPQTTPLLVASRRRDDGEQENLFGTETLDRVTGRWVKDAYKLHRRCVHDGLVTNWVDMRLLMEHAVRETLRRMGCEGEFVVMVVNPVLTPTTSCAKQLEILFDAFPACQAVRFVPESSTVIRSHTSFAAIVVDMGVDGTTVTPIIEGMVVDSAVQRYPAGGAAVTRALFHSMKTNPALSRVSPGDLQNLDVLKPAILRTCSLHEISGKTGGYDAEFWLPTGEQIFIDTEKARDSFEPLFTGPVSYDQCSESNPWYTEPGRPEETLAAAVTKVGGVVAATLAQMGCSPIPIPVILAGRAGEEICVRDRLRLELSKPSGLHFDVLHSRHGRWAGVKVLAQYFSRNPLLRSATRTNFEEHGAEDVLRSL